MRHLASRLALVAALALASPVACADAPDAVAAAPAEPAEPVAPAPQSAPKSKIPIDVEGAAKAELGQPVDVDVSVTALADVRGLRVEFRPGEGLEILEGGDTLRGTLWARGDSETRSLRVVADQPGTVYVYVHVYGVFDGRDRGAAYAVPIRVGADPRANLKAADTPYELDEDGQLLIQVPGEHR